MTINENREEKVNKNKYNNYQGLKWENYGLRQHQAMEEKIGAANILKKEAGKALEGCPILVDG